MKIFNEKDGSFSWRKGLTFLAGFVFSFASIGYLFGLRKLPPPYWATIAGVFAFYFSKDLFKKKQNESNN